MENETYTRAVQAYSMGDWATAASLLSALYAHEAPTSDVAHMWGNALMKLNMPREAVQIYQLAAEDPLYPKRGAVGSNLGKALVAIGDYHGAISVLENALTDEHYASKYKIYTTLGGAYQKLGDVKKAGVAFRSAAIDEKNADPSKSLLNLGACFMELRRPADAVEAYRTALDFCQPSIEMSMIYSNLGQAYVASNRMEDALKAFEHATDGNVYALTASAESDYETARLAVERAKGLATPSAGSTEDFLRGYNAYDPLDPMGESGELMPSPENTGFFTMTEKDMISFDKNDRKVKRKGRHVGLKILISILVIAIVIGAAGVYAYSKGYGYPSASMVTENLISTNAAGKDTVDIWSDSVTDNARIQAMDQLQGVSSGNVTGAESDAAHATTFVEAELKEGGKVNYTVDLERDGISWKVYNVELTFLSNGDTDAVDNTNSTPADISESVSEVVPESTTESATESLTETSDETDAESVADGSEDAVQTDEASEQDDSAAESV